MSIKDKLRRGALAFSALALLGVGAIAGGPAPTYQHAQAAVGGGSDSGGGGGAAIGNIRYTGLVRDDAQATVDGNPIQGWGDNSTRYFLNQIYAATGHNLHPAGVIDGYGDAMKQAISRHSADYPEAPKRARVVGLTYVYGDKPTGNPTGHSLGYSSAMRSNFDSGVWPLRSLTGDYDSASVQAIRGEFDTQFANIGDRPRVVCVAMNEYEPVTLNFQPNNPAISLEKYDAPSGFPAGDRDSADAALEIEAGQDVGITFRVTNVGDVALNNVTVADKTTTGSGEVTGLTCPGTTLEPGKSMDCQGVLSGVEVGSSHANTATATGESAVDGTKVSDTDPWHGRVPHKPSISLEKYDVLSGFPAGDRDSAGAALSIEAGKDLEIGFDIRNTGNIELENISLTDLTTDGTGTVTVTQCETDLDGLTLAPDESISCTGTLSGVEERSTHANLATVTGHSVLDGQAVTDDDPWHASTLTPDPAKDVVSSPTQGGDESSIDDRQVLPGQAIDYRIDIDTEIPVERSYDIDRFAVVDNYDPMFIPNKESVTLTDSRTDAVIPTDQYTLTWDDEATSFTIEFTDEWIAENLAGGSPNGWLTLSFSGMVNADVEDGYTLTNQATEVINETETATNIPGVRIPGFNPDKEDLNTDNVDIDGKTVTLGDIIRYRLTMDASVSPDELAYPVHKLGMIDDYDHEYLQLDVENISVINKETGEDVTEMFNIQISNGVAYIFAKHVDGEQPEDLDAYARADIDPLNDPLIDQSLLGHQYWVILDTEVIKEVDQYVIKNTAHQILENTPKQTRTVYNPLVEINPTKDVVIDVAGESVDGAEIELYSTFNYQLNSSVLPADRAYGSTAWEIVDDFDEVYDAYTGQWLVTASRDLYDGETLVASAGDVLDRSGEGEAAMPGAFTVTEADGVLTLTVGEAYLDVLNTRLDIEGGFSAYVQMERLRPGTVDNEFTETHNDVERVTNKVTTHTPEDPSITVEKFDVASGMDAGDRDSADESLTLTAGAQTMIGFEITNTGNVPLKNITLVDQTIDGTGTVTDIQCETDLDGLVLGMGETVSCEGVLSGVQAGTDHANNVDVTGQSIYTDTVVDDSDLWHGKVPAPPVTEVLRKTGAGSMIGLAGLAMATTLLGGGAAVAKRRQDMTR